MTVEYQPKLGEDRQYNFFDIVTESGHLGKLFDDHSEALEVEKKKKFREELLVKARGILESIRVPERYIPENCFVSIDLLGGYPECDETLIFINRETGLMIEEINLEKVNKKGGGENVYKPTHMTFYQYRGVDFEHPISKEAIQATEITEKSWKVDSRFRRIERFGARILTAVMETDWDSESSQPRRVYGALIESVYELADKEKSLSVRFHETWTESFRSFLMYDELLMYTPKQGGSGMEKVPRLRKIYSPQESEPEWFMNTPQELEGPNVLMF